MTTYEPLPADVAVQVANALPTFSKAAGDLNVPDATTLYTQKTTWVAVVQNENDKTAQGESAGSPIEALTLACNALGLFV